MQVYVKNGVSHPPPSAGASDAVSVPSRQKARRKSNSSLPKNKRFRSHVLLSDVMLELDGRERSDCMHAWLYV